MNNWIVFTIGFTAQLLFSSRLILQWLLSEKKKRVVVPASFWLYSLAASFLLFIYGYLRNDFAIMLGQSITYFIYIRNMHFKGDWIKFPVAARWFLLIFPFIIVFYYFNNNRPDIYHLLNKEQIAPWLLVLGITGQVVFTFRFILQWIYSERLQQSVMPLVFWYCSLLGALLIIIYAVFRKDPVLIVGQAFGFVVYFRNIMIAFKEE